MVDVTVQRPLKKEGIVYKDFEKESLLYNPQTKAVHVLNKTSSMVWELCDGKHSLGMIEKKIKEKYEVSSGTDVRGDIEETINKFSKLGLVELRR